MPTKKNFMGGQQNYDPKTGEYQPSLKENGEFEKLDEAQFEREN